MNGKGRVFRVTGSGISEQDQLLIRVLLSLMPATEAPSWTFVDHPPADVVIVDIDSPQGLQYLGAHPRDALITLGCAAAGSYPHLPKPIRTGAMRDCLERVAAAHRIGTGAPGTAGRGAPSVRGSVRDGLQRMRRRSSPTPAVAEEGPAYAPATHRTLHALLAQMEGDAMRDRTLVILGTEPLLLIDPLSGLGFVKDGLDGLRRLQNGEQLPIRFQRLQRQDLAAFRLQAEEMPLERLRWYCGIHFSSGRLLRTLSDWPAFRLRRWPDFGSVPYRREFARIARHLMTRPAAIDQLVLRGGIAEAQVAAFLNAAYLCGWLERASAPAPEPVKPPPRGSSRAGLIDMLRKSLGIGALRG